MAKRKKVTRRTKASIESFEAKANKIINELSEKRDELRLLVERYSDILETIDDGVEQASDYLSHFHHAVDRMSESL
jgi:hypothetical protein